MGPADRSGALQDVARASLPGEGGVRSGESVTVSFHITVSAEQLAELGGRAVLELNLVSDGVCWFDLAGSDAVRITVPPT